jgi:hypothetical protein
MLMEITTAITIISWFYVLFTLEREKSIFPQPHQINTSDHFWGRFGSYEREASAMWIARLMKKKNAWCEFTRQEIEEFYSFDHGFRFNGLDRDGHVTVKGGIFTVTPLFIGKLPLKA